MNRTKRLELAQAIEARADLYEMSSLRKYARLLQDGDMSEDQIVEELACLAQTTNAEVFRVAAEAIRTRKIPKKWL